MNTITSIIAEKIKDNNLKLFEKLNNETIKVRNPQFVNIHYLFQSNQSPKMSLSILQEEKDGDFYKFIQAVPKGSKGKSFPIWSQKPSMDWKDEGDTLITFPKGNVFLLEGRGRSMFIESTIVDTRVIDIQTPINFTVKEISPKNLEFYWDVQDKSTIFHVLIEKLVGTRWISLPYIRSTENIASYKAQPGYYRFSVRSGIYIPEQFKKYSINTLSQDKTITVKIPEILKYSSPHEWNYYLVNGYFSNPLPPTNFGGTRKSNNTIFFVWQNHPTNESIIHILEEKLEKDQWIRQPLIRIPSDRSSYISSVKNSGKYRYAIRSAYSLPEGGIVKTSSISSWIEFTIP